MNGLAAGAASARLGAYLCFFVCDQPYMTEAHLRSFWEEFYKSGKTMGRMRAGARFGSPAVFAPQFRPALMALMGDEGGRTLFAGHEGEIYCYGAAPEVLRDFDYPWRRVAIHKKEGGGAIPAMDRAAAFIREKMGFERN